MVSMDASARPLQLSMAGAASNISARKAPTVALHLPWRLHPSLSARPRFIYRALINAASILQTNIQESGREEEIPTPIVVIDQESDPEATVVEVSFGDRLGALLDTMQALKDLGLDVVSSRMSVEGPITRKHFSIIHASSGRKIEDLEMLEAIRLTIINNMLEYHPESSALLSMGTTFGIKAPQQLDIDVATRIHISDEDPSRSLLRIATADRPGLLQEIVKVIRDINVAFEYAEFDTEGLLAKAKFHVNYHGAALNKALKQPRRQEVMKNTVHFQDLFHECV